MEGAPAGQEPACASARGGSRGDARLFIFFFFLNSSSVVFKKIIIIINPLEGCRKQINISQ